MNRHFKIGETTISVLPYFQPIVSMKSDQIIGYEVLSRFFDSGKILDTKISIDRFEDQKLLDGLLIFLLEYTFRQRLKFDPNLFFSFNLSPSQISDTCTLDDILSLISLYEFPHERIKIEITESVIISDLALCTEFMTKLNATGISFVMDDFGTGYSSLTILSSLPFSGVKIDQKFVHSCVSRKEDRKIISAIVGLANSLDIDVIAEGIETVEQADLLRKIGCTKGQGYLFSPPRPLKRIGKLNSNPAVNTENEYQRLSIEERAFQISSLYNSKEVAICFIDRDYIIRDASMTFCRRIGFDKKRVIGADIHVLLPDTRTMLEWLKSFRERGLPYPPYRFTRESGDIDLVMLIQVRDESEEILGYSIISLEIFSKTINGIMAQKRLNVW
ncbi:MULTISPECIES: EAL domain-containing protein [Gluconobacter]|uniref:sensor domain-containing phosphodiesterase n=1 Tax=Gluconobacter TaxID=441 RepID=UPI0002998778|nr:MULTISPECIES: EAL domain-containing protein [Gluconobacter]AFW03254.1 diguanylate cyclase/phosphodiesterase [Gluconobacter oxydans H24]